jgi:hypothetical protein
MIDAELVQNRSLKIAHVHGVADDVLTELVRFPVHHAAFNPGPGQP